MTIKYPYLIDTDFLKKFDQITIKEQFVKISVLTFQEKIIREIQGEVTTGSISVDGNSSVRRTANLTLVAPEADNDLTDINHILSLNKKIRLEIGFTNTTNQYKEYKILWFPLGTYVIINASLSSGTSGTTISLQLKDKMCLLNGECGGVIPAPTVFHEYDTINEKGELVTSQPTIEQIIRELVNHYGGEQLGRIIISGIDTKVKKVVKWLGDIPLYIRENQSTNMVTYTTEGTQDDLSFNMGEDIGFIYSNFTYPSELIGDAGSTVTDILDQIKETLGNYEYFYDLDGNFVFQEIPNFLNTKQSTSIIRQLEQSAENYVVDATKGRTVYRFNNRNIITSYTNNPQYNMIKNDFIVWGKRKNSDGKEFPIRYHLAIDEKPAINNLYFVLLYDDDTDGLQKVIIPTYYKSSEDAPEKRIDNNFICFVDRIENKLVIRTWEKDGITKQQLDKKYTPCFVYTNDWRTELFFQGIMAENNGTDSNYYYTELKNEWTKIYKINAKQVDESVLLKENINEKKEHLFPNIQYIAVDGDDNFNYSNLNVYIGSFREDVLNKPTNIDFFLDFIDSGADISKISIPNIGRRSKILNDDKINCIFESDIPDYVLIEKGQGKETQESRIECLKKGQPYVQVDSQIYDAIGQGGHLNSAYVAIQDLLYQHTGYNESISISCVPIYYLEPNTRIYVKDKFSGISGEYTITSFNLPLDISGTMSISANRIIDRV